MLRKPNFLIVTCLLSLFTSASLQAEDQSRNVELKLREALRGMALQLRDSESARATLQATQTDNEQKIQELTAQVDKLTKQAEADKAASDKEVADLKEQIATGEVNMATLKKSYQVLETEFKKVSDIARTKETQRAKFETDAILLRRRVADQETRNTALFNIATEILKRYEKFGLGEALTAREPFVGTTRVKLENLVQDYSDKIADQKIKP
jgi:chromosome segregation ATPase